MPGGQNDGGDTRILGADGTPIGNVSDALKVQFSGDSVFIPHEHQKIHDGYSFTRTFEIYLDKDSIDYIYLKTPDTATRAHLIWYAASVGESKICLCENPTATAGSAYTVFNRERNSANTPELDVKAIGTVTAGGTMVSSDVLYATNQTSFTGRSDSEFVLKQNEEYLVKIESRASSNKIHLRLNWYEK